MGNEAPLVVDEIAMEDHGLAMHVVIDFSINSCCVAGASLQRSSRLRGR